MKVKDSKTRPSASTFWRSMAWLQTRVWKRTQKSTILVHVQGMSAPPENGHTLHATWRGGIWGTTRWLEFLTVFFRSAKTRGLFSEKNTSKCTKNSVKIFLKSCIWGFLKNSRKTPIIKNYARISKKVLRVWAFGTAVNISLGVSASSISELAICWYVPWRRQW